MSENDDEIKKPEETPPEGDKITPEPESKAADPAIQNPNNKVVSEPPKESKPLTETIKQEKTPPATFQQKDPQKPEERPQQPEKKIQQPETNEKKPEITTPAENPTNPPVKETKQAKNTSPESGEDIPTSKPIPKINQQEEISENDTEETAEKKSSPPVEQTAQPEITSPESGEDIPSSKPIPDINQQGETTPDETTEDQNAKIVTEENYEQALELGEETFIDYYLESTLRMNRAFIPKLFESSKKIIEEQNQEDPNQPENIPSKKEFMSWGIDKQLAFFRSHHKDIKLELLKKINPYSTIQIKGLVDAFRIELKISFEKKIPFNPVRTAEKINSNYHQRMLRIMQRKGLDRSPAELMFLKKDDLIKRVIQSSLLQTFQNQPGLQQKYKNMTKNFQPDHSWREFEKLLSHPHVKPMISSSILMQKIVPKRKMIIPGLKFDYKNLKARVVSLTGDIPETTEDRHHGFLLDSAIAYHTLAQAAAQGATAATAKENMSKQQGEEEQAKKGQEEAQKRQKSYLEQMQKRLSEAQTQQSEAGKSSVSTTVKKAATSSLMGNLTSTKGIFWTYFGGSSLFWGPAAYSSVNNNPQVTQTVTQIGEVGLQFIQSLFA